MIRADRAALILDEVLEECSLEPRTVTLSKLQSYSEYRRERYSVQKTVLIAVLGLFCLVPFFFIAPRFETELVSPPEAETPVYEISLQSSFPVSSVTAELEGHQLVVTELGQGRYSVNPTRSGEMTICVKCINGQYNSETLTLENIDGSPPELIYYEKIEEALVLHLKDEGSGIDYSSAWGQLAGGSSLYPSSHNEAEGTISFPFPPEDLNIYISDLRGNTLQLVITLDK